MQDKDAFITNISLAIHKATTYIASMQEENGSFISFSSPDPQDFFEAIPFPTIFSSALILSCLSSIEESETLIKVSIP